MAKGRILTDQDREKIIKLYGSKKYTRKALATMFYTSTSTIDRVLENTYPTGLQRPDGSVRFTAEEDAKIVKMYKEGMSFTQIGGELNRNVSSIYGRAVLLGLHQAKHTSSTHANPMTSQPRTSEAIWPKDIAEVRESVKVGDIIVVNTCKGFTDDLTNGGTSGARKRAKVVSVDHPKFCLVELLDGGFLDSKLWVDLVMEKRGLEKAEAALAGSV
jgi:transposase